MTGEWIIQIEDNFEGTSGNLTDAELQICYSGEIILDTDNPTQSNTLTGSIMITY